MAERQRDTAKGAAEKKRRSRGRQRHGQAASQRRNEARREQLDAAAQSPTRDEANATKIEDRKDAAIAEESLAGKQESGAGAKREGDPSEKGRKTSPPPEKSTTPEEQNRNPSKVASKRRKAKESKMTLEELETEEFVFWRPEGKRSLQFPNDEYYCRACNLHLTDDDRVKRHIGQRGHQNHAKARRDILKMKKMPEPSESQLWSVTQLLEGVFKRNAILEDDEQKASRTLVCKEMDEMIKAKLPGCEVILYGSSLNGFGLKDSDVNLFVRYTKSSNLTPATSMISTLKLLRSSELVTDVVSELDDALPRLYFTHKRTALKCKLCVGQGKKFLKLTGLLRHLSSLDRRASVLGVAFRLWAKLCRLDEPQNCALPSVSFPLMVVFYLQHCEPPVLPVLKQKRQVSADSEKTRHGSNENEDDDLIDDNWDDAFEEKGSWQSKNTESIGSLWLRLLKFYLVDVDIERVLVSITDAESVERESRGIPNRRIAIEDPFLSKKNLASTLNSQRVFEYFLQRLRQTCLYYGQTKVESRSNATVDCQPSETVDEIAARVVGVSLETAKEEVLAEREAYQFSASVFNSGTPLPPACYLCRGEGHTFESCPEEMPIELTRLPTLTRQHVDVLNFVCKQIVADLASTEREESARHRVLAEVESFVRSAYDGCTLTLFGSSVNGFGFRNSDMDISMTHPTEIFDPGAVVRKLSEMFKSKRREYSAVLAIPNARIPIVKFRHNDSGLEGDISMENALAQRNTAMLRLYCNFDPRVKTLGYCIKAFAKISEIGDAARGSLSSYAYVLMVLHYLQRTEPPVIPCLQEIYEGDEKPVKECEGWNAYYCSDIEKIRKLWGKSKNWKSAGELWLGLLRYYCEEFDFKTMVVSPKQLGPLTKFEKGWASRPLAVEDPFKLSHNLGGGVTRKMRKFILECFANARAHFGSTRPCPVPDICDYYFNPVTLTNNSQPPSDKSCRECGQYGHFAADCPNKEDRGRNKRTGYHRMYYRFLKQCHVSRTKDHVVPRKKDANTTFFESLLTPGKSEQGTAPAPAASLLQLVPDQVTRKRMLAASAEKAKPPATEEQKPRQPTIDMKAAATSSQQPFGQPPGLGHQPSPVVPPTLQPPYRPQSAYSQPVHSSQYPLAQPQSRPVLLPPQSQTSVQFSSQPMTEHPSRPVYLPPQSQPQMPTSATTQFRTVAPAAQAPMMSPQLQQQQQQHTVLAVEQQCKAWMDYYLAHLQAYQKQEMQLRQQLHTQDSGHLRETLSTNLQYQHQIAGHLNTLKQQMARLPGWPSTMGPPKAPGRL